MFNIQLSREKKKPRFIAFANFHGISTPTMADFKLPTWLHSTSSQNPENVTIIS